MFDRAVGKKPSIWIFF